MKLLFDQNLSPRLVARLSGLFPGSEHTQSLGLDRSSDAILWAFARNNEFLIVTKDVDFSDRSALVGYPPKVIWVRMGNCTTLDIEGVVRRNHAQIEAFNEDDKVGVLVLFA